MVTKLQSLLSSPWNYALVALVLCPLLVSITCWRQLQSADAPHGQRHALRPIEAALVADTGDSASRRSIEENAPPPELELLNEIRQEIGSPLDASLFQGIQDSKSTNDSFGTTYSNEASGPNANSNGLPARDVWQSPRMEPVNPDIHHRSALRNAARLLDEGAADLEGVESYQMADNLRNWAAQLRDDARGQVPVPATLD